MLICILCREEQEQVCRDLIQALSTPVRPDTGHGLFSPESSLHQDGSGECTSAKEGLFHAVLERLTQYLSAGGEGLHTPDVR